MKKLLIAFCLLVLCACGKEKSVLLPEIQNTKITEITDVSPAYLFYDETKPDSLELNKNNLIISTNWLVNVDKRLTLKQVIPSIIKLQEKKRNSDHKNKNVRNYFTCNATSIKNLGFVDFTDVVYDYEREDKDGKIEPENTIFIVVLNLNKIIVYPLDKDDFETNINDFETNLKESLPVNNEKVNVKLSFNEILSFQDYITLKYKLSQLNLENTTINNHEYIIN
ncbi:hypothetical protein [Lacinutrix sp.]|uniref:hypothetical protein n=1 Tax=Lacinutrix sp. TaxID=1937692 RepID=UPI0026268462|nr:hypothetical protein [Lacinutrix sp.]MDG1714155.1 hypothetical protein [Lacinutrix sp.]